MNTLECILSRRSIRKFKQKKIDREVIETIIDHVRWSPSWNNTKVARFTVVNDEKTKADVGDKFTDVYRVNGEVMKASAAIFVVSCVKGRSGFERDGSYSTEKGAGWEMFDCGIATQTLCLAAAELGIGTVIMGAFDYEGIRQFLDIPDDESVIAVVAAGYPDEEPKAPRRKEVNEILRFV